MRGKLILWGAAVAIALGSTAAVASVVVVKSLGPSSKAYPPGKTLPESAKISLQGGDVVTLLGPGSAQTLRGPGNFPAQVAMNSAAASRGRFGALRAAEVAKNPSIWDIDVTQSGKMCVTSTSKVQLWRPDAESEAKIKIRSSNRADRCRQKRGYHSNRYHCSDQLDRNDLGFPRRAEERLARRDHGFVAEL